MPSLPKKLAGGALIACIWALMLYPLVKVQFLQSDTFWLLEIGRRIVELHGLPVVDTYSFTNGGKPWVVYQWLSELVFQAANALAGLTGVAILGEAIIATLFCVLIFRHLLRQKSSALAAVVAISCCVYAVYPDIAALRPQLFSFVLFWLLLTECETSTAGGARHVIAAFIIGAFWANFHLSFLVGLVVLIASLLASVRDKRRALLLLCMLSAFFLATLLTPQGVSLWSFVGSMKGMFPSQEVEPLNWSNKPMLSLLTAAIIFSCVYLRRQISFASVLVLVLLLFAGCTFARMIIYFCIAGCPLVAQALTRLQLAAVKWMEPKGAGVVKVFNFADEAIAAVASSSTYAFGVLAISAIVVLVQPISLPRTIPVQAAEFISAHQISGNLFCTAHGGSYLMYRFHGSVPVYIDTRVDLYDKEFCLQFIQIVQHGTDWKPVFSKYKITSALIPNDSAIDLALAQEADWQRVYKDSSFSLYVRKPITSSSFNQPVCDNSG
jgi:hypothetical protein